VIAVDTSAWIEFLRGTGSPVHFTLSSLIREGARLAVTEVVVAELLAGARSGHDAGELRARLLSLRILRLRGLPGYEAAAELYRACRAAGDTLRGITDCLVAVPVIEAGATLLQLDRDFEILARHTRLRLEPLTG
jgi:predicted nucleic acid-binding protein